VVIISVDGMRPDALDQADTPIMDELRAAGAYSPNAQTVYISYTLPGHASMLSGMTPDKHGLNFPHPYIDWPGLNGQTLFSVAHDAGLETAMVVGKKKFDYIVLPNSVDRLSSADVNDPDVKDQAIEFIEDGLPDVLFIHFPDTDRVGHAHGWMSPNQLQAIASVDSLIGEILAALEAGGHLDSTLLIITSDHGGHYFGHGDDSPVDRTIPWLAVGPGVPQGITLTQPVNIYDTAATVLYALELPIPEMWDGQPILGIFQHSE
jgi:arylsulfatase A-like enzyme